MAQLGGSKGRWHRRDWWMMGGYRPCLGRGKSWVVSYTWAEEGYENGTSWWMHNFV